MNRRGPGIISVGEFDYFDRRMSLIRAATDHTKAMSMLADLARWNATRLRRKSYG